MKTMDELWAELIAEDESGQVEMAKKVGDIIAQSLLNGEQTMTTNNTSLTPANVVSECRKYAESLKASVPFGERSPINGDILMRFSFYMDYAVNWTNLVIASKVHDVITAYFLTC